MTGHGNSPAIPLANPPANPPTNVPTQPPVVAHDDYEDWTDWADEALNHASRNSDPQWVADTLKQWHQLSSQVKASFALAVRNFRQAERAFAAVRTELDAKVEDVIVRTSGRVTRKATDQLYKDLKVHLQARHDPAVIASKVLEDMVKVHQHEQFADEMLKLTEDWCEMYAHDRDATAD
jgi:hypothetical protein